MIIDRSLVFAGSYNWTTAAETENAENILQIDDPATVANFVANYATHTAHSTQWTP